MDLDRHGYAVLTLHRPSNVDDPVQLRSTIEAIASIAQKLPVLFPIHPRTAANAAKFNINHMHPWDGSSPIGKSGIWTMPPASYIDFLALVENSAMVITDSGGIQEETTYLGVPCLTFRNSTERPITVTDGTNRLIGNDPAKLYEEAAKILKQGHARTNHQPPPLWDGRASERIVEVIRNYLGRSSAA
ncbi:MAG TPA: UDP-N-acetylglucosamine 2-epimerase [Terriglobales bacterium]|nr:UDP-N-acetylglucosamine 2-epimerase [Terriglobales bacterium]